MKINFKKILLLFIFSFVALAVFFTQMAWSCTTYNTITQTQQFSNCTIDTAYSTNGISVFTNTLKWNTPGAFFLLWVGIAVSIAIFFLAQDKSFARYMTIAFYSMMVALIMWIFNLVGYNTLIISGSLFALTVIASVFFHSNR